tara:strand:- start:786 stop:938 length:153 start_codon:yes stop_codon:yes gene_type:complete
MATYQCEISLIGQSFNKALDQMFKEVLIKMNFFEEGTTFANLKVDSVYDN